MCFFVLYPLRCKDRHFPSNYQIIILKISGLYLFISEIIPIFAALFEKEIEEYERIRQEYPVPSRANQKYGRKEIRINNEYP